MESTNPTIKINFTGNRRVNYTITIPREYGSTELRGVSYVGEKIEIPIIEKEVEYGD